MYYPDGMIEQYVCILGIYMYMYMYVDGSSINKCKCFLKYIYKALFISCFESSWIQKTPKITDAHRQN